MAINKKLIHFQKKATFDTELAAGNILDTSIVFIKDAKLIWTHGNLYGLSEILEYNELSSFPTTGETGKIYVATDTNLIYRWSGTQYVEISASLTLGETSSTAYAGNKGKAIADALDNKVDKEKDKGLSTNDYTTAEKTKLEGIEENANNYSLPTASASTLGGIKVGDNLSISNGVLSSKDTTYSTATQSANGLMSSTDKTKLDGIATGANNYTLPTATTSVLGGVKSSTTGTTADRDYKVEVNADGTMKVNVPWVNTTYNNATTSAAGLMSGADKAKLDGIAENANNYTLPTATTTTLGGVIVDASLSSSSTNPVQNKAIKTAIDEINSQLSWTKID